MRFQNPLAATLDDVMWANAVILGTTENFSYMRGALKDFFDRIYYPCLDKTDRLPYAIFIRAGNDGNGAHQSIQRIVVGLKWKAVQKPEICSAKFTPDYVKRCKELGMAKWPGIFNVKGELQP